MQAFLDVPTFFSSVYLVDLSPSLCAVAIKRFKRLGWDVKVLCQDARTFQLEDHLGDSSSRMYTAKPVIEYPSSNVEQRAKADLITMSYSLSMIPDYYNLVDSLTRLLAPHGIIGVVDFYVQSTVETAGRNYIGGSFNRHVNWLSRVVWRSWFDCDRVGLEAARRVSLHHSLYTESPAFLPCARLGLPRVSIWYEEICRRTKLPARCDPLLHLPWLPARASIFHNRASRTG